MRRRPSVPGLFAGASAAATRLEAPTPTESGVYPLGVFSDAEVAMNLDEVEDTLAAFAVAGARLRRRGRTSL